MYSVGNCSWMKQQFGEIGSHLNMDSFSTWLPSTNQINEEPVVDVEYPHVIYLAEN